MIELVDDQIGRILEFLDRTGQREQTVIVVTTDHGDMLGDHGLTRKGCRFYEGLVRVPLIFSWPGTIKNDFVSDALVELTDIVPTLLEMSDCSLPRQLDGRSLLPLLAGKASPQHHRDFVRSEYYDGQQGGCCNFGTMYCDGHWKLVVYHGHQVGELYDLQNDPIEQINLWDCSEYRDIKLDLVKASFDSSVLAMDVGPPLLRSAPARRL